MIRAALLTVGVAITFAPFLLIAAIIAGIARQRGGRS